MRVFFLREPETKFPFACVASELTKISNHDYVCFSLSILNPLDQTRFDRGQGRMIAEDRLKTFLSHEPKRALVNLLSGSVPAEGNVKRRIMQWLEANDKFDRPRYRRLKRAAEQWLATRPVVEGEYLPPENPDGGTPVSNS